MQKKCRLLPIWKDMISLTKTAVFSIFYTGDEQMKNGINISKTVVLMFGLVMLLLFFGCGTIPSALSKTRELSVNELDGVVLVSAIQERGSRVQVSRDYYATVINPETKFVILAVQLQNVVANKEYDLANIVLLDGEKRILPGMIKYFSGNTAFGVGTNWGIPELTLFGTLPFKVRRGGRYTVNLLYVVDKDSVITRANIFGTVVEFDLNNTVSHNLMDKFY